MFLSDHFTLAEMTNSMYAQRHGINNRLKVGNSRDDWVIQNLTHLCTTILEPVRTHFGKPITPSSGYRCEELNKAIGGSARSQHMVGEAVDFEIAGVRNIDLAYWCQSNLGFDQLILECYDPDDGEAGWVHISTRRESSNRNVVNTMGRSIFAKGLPDLKGKLDVK